MKVVFMGTPDFAVPTLRMLIDENYDIQAVVTQPDRPKGRGKKLAPTPVKEVANEYNIPVLQPERVRTPEFIQAMKEIAPDVIIVIAFGQILPKDILDIPQYGCINVHGSLLPKYRGAAPIQWAIINGEKTTGVTTMYMDVGMDTGDMILKKEMMIEEEDTAGSIHDKMAVLGAEALKETLQNIQVGMTEREKQNDDEATYAPMLDKKMGLIDWNKSSNAIIHLIRGLSPWPSAYTFYKGNMLKIWTAKPYTLEESNYNIGEIIDVIDDQGFVVKTQDGSILITEIQAQGGRRMTVEEYLRGHKIEKNTVLGFGV
jgi:methionyl-tRNA formyltransferase